MALATTCAVCTIAHSSQALQVAGSMNQISTRRLDTKEKRDYSFLNNLHRYFLYMVIPILLIKWWDITHSMAFDNGGYGFTGGTVILTLEAVCLTMYVTSCHALETSSRWNARPMGLWHFENSR